MTECLCREKSIFDERSKPFDLDKNYSYGYKYDELGRIIQAKDPENGSAVNYEYDEQGNFCKAYATLVGNGVFGLVDSGMIVEEFYTDGNLVKRTYDGRVTFEGFYGKSNKPIKSKSVNNGVEYYLHDSTNDKQFVFNNSEYFINVIKAEYDPDTKHAIFMYKDGSIRKCIIEKGYCIDTLHKVYEKTKDRETWYKCVPNEVSIWWSKNKIRTIPSREVTSTYEINWYENRSGFFKSIKYADGGYSTYEVSEYSPYSNCNLVESYDPKTDVFKQYTLGSKLYFVKSGNFGEFTFGKFVKSGLIYPYYLGYKCNHRNGRITSIVIEDGNTTQRFKAILSSDKKYYKLVTNTNKKIGEIDDKGVLTKLNALGYNFELRYNRVKWLITRLTETTDTIVTERVYNSSGELVSNRSRRREK